MAEQTKIQLTGSASLCFSYGQFIAFDANEREPGSLWTERHINQGFIRRTHSIGVRTLVEYGTATIGLSQSIPFSFNEYDRVISIPIDLPSGVLRIEGPEEYPTERAVILGAGIYQLTFCQSLDADGNLWVDIFVLPTTESEPRSILLKADGGLRGYDELIETGSSA